MVKSATTERISNHRYEPTAGHERLYEAWSQTGAGLLISGNIMIDRIHMESAGNVCFDDESMLPKIKKWVEAGTKYGNQFWVQISHAGRQTNRLITGRPLAPSEVQLKKIGLFGKPRSMTEKDIEDTIRGFERAADIAKRAGFNGIQIHSAHGYLLSQFLSPHTNIRKDQYGGNIENRSRLLLTIIRKIRKVTGRDFPISVKLNSSDFQKGGMTQEDSLQVIKLLNEEKIDLLEISGGTYEKVAFFLLNESALKSSTRQREAYFIDFADRVRKVCNIPLLITGGFRSFDFCNEALEKGELDFVGMARPFITDRDQISSFIEGEIPQLKNLIIRTGIGKLEDAAEGGFYARQLIRMSKGKKVNLRINALGSSNYLILHEMAKVIAKKISS